MLINVGRDSLVWSRNYSILDGIKWKNALNTCIHLSLLFDCGCNVPSFLELLPLWLSHGDMLHPGSIRQNEPFLFQVVYFRAFNHSNRKRNQDGWAGLLTCGPLVTTPALYTVMIKPNWAMATDTSSFPATLRHPQLTVFPVSRWQYWGHLPVLELARAGPWGWRQ